MAAESACRLDLPRFDFETKECRHSVPEERDRNAPFSPHCFADDFPIAVEQAKQVQREQATSRRGPSKTDDHHRDVSRSVVPFANSGACAAVGATTGTTVTSPCGRN